MKEKETYKEKMEGWVYDLMYSALELSSILGTSVKNGMVKVNYQSTAELIRHLQAAALKVADELALIASGGADLSEIYPEMKGGKR